ncbi:uncharacterized protein VB005_02553 [Metarhizium brunneum]
MPIGISLFREPGLIKEVERQIERQKIELQFVKAYEDAKERLKSKNKLPPYILAHCSAFVAAVVSSTEDGSSNFDTEVRKLTRDEMEFASISLNGKALHRLKESFQASALREYMTSQQITCETHNEISYHLKNEIPMRHKDFDSIYQSAQPSLSNQSASYPNTVPSGIVSMEIGRTPKRRRIDSETYSHDNFLPKPVDKGTDITTNPACTPLIDRSCAQRDQSESTVIIPQHPPNARPVDFVLSGPDKENLKHFFSDSFLEQMERFPLWGNKITTTVVDVRYKGTEVEVWVNPGEDLATLETNDVFRGPPWGTTELREVQCLCIRTDQNRVQELVEKLFWPEVFQLSSVK